MSNLLPTIETNCKDANKHVNEHDIKNHVIGEYCLVDGLIQITTSKTVYKASEVYNTVLFRKKKNLYSKYPEFKYEIELNYYNPECECNSLDYNEYCCRYRCGFGEYIEIETIEELKKIRESYRVFLEEEKVKKEQAKLDDLKANEEQKKEEKMSKTFKVMNGLSTKITNPWNKKKNSI